MKVLLLILSLMMTACMKTNYNDCEWQGGQRYVSQMRTEPTILVIGDSIADQYFPIIQKSLPTYEVIFTPCNAMTSAWSKNYIDRWLIYTPRFESIIFNAGIWDDNVIYNTSLADYEDNMRIIAKAIHSKTDHPLYILTTEILLNTPGFTTGREVELNDIATRVMNEEGIPILDLYAVSLTIHNEHLSDIDVHYTPAGVTVLAEAVLTELFTRFGIK